MTTLRQIEANRRNSLLSTGPGTDLGKDVSKRNALKHGLAGAGTVLPDGEETLVNERFEKWAITYRPKTEPERWLVEVMAINSVRLDRCMTHEREERTTQSLRAEISWDDDHTLAACQLGQSLSKRPAVVARQLEQTPHGCDWLIDRWESLGRILVEKGRWDEEQRSLAFDLLGTPRELRDDPARLGKEEGFADLVRREVDRLAARKEIATVLDDRNRALTRSGRIDETTGPLALARRYEARCARQLQWAMRQFFRLTLGLGLDDPSLGGPPFRDGDPTLMEHLIEMAGAPVVARDGTPALAPPPPPAPAPAPAPKAVPTPPVAQRSTFVPIRACPVPLPALNRRERRAAKARARHAAKG